jgi:hypothetical protein
MVFHSAFQVPQIIPLFQNSHMVLRWNQGWMTDAKGQRHGAGASRYC